MSRVDSTEHAGQARTTDASTDHGPVMLSMPVELTADMLRAVRRDPLTEYEDRDMMNSRIGWLLCAWDVLVRCQRNGVAGKAPSDKQVTSGVSPSLDNKERSE